MAPLKSPHSPLTASEAKANRVDSDRRRSSQTHKGVLGPHSSHNSFLTDSSKTLVLRISARYHIVRASILSMKHVHCVVHEAGRERGPHVLYCGPQKSHQISNHAINNEIQVGYLESNVTGDFSSDRKKRCDFIGMD